jgi:predicted nucleotidyltransferase
MDLPLSVLSQLTSTLEQRGITYVLVGSFASSLHGMYRSTADIDILADIKPEQIRPLFDAMRERFYLDEQTMQEAVVKGRSFNAIHFDSVFKVDIFVSGSNEFALAQLNRRILRKLAPDKDETVYIATAEDTVLAKLQWYKAGNETSTTQWNDVLGVLATSADRLDLNYLDKWSGSLGLTNLLQRALAQVKED